MKRSEINTAIADAMQAFATHHWHLPPHPRWDVTSFGLGDFHKYGLVLVNLAELPEYCEKLMYCARGQRTPFHTHGSKQEDIICRIGTLAMDLRSETGDPIHALRDGEAVEIPSGSRIYLKPGERITLYPGALHEFWPVSDYCILSEVSTRNDDLHDNFFADERVGRFDAVEEDEPALYRLLSDS